MILTGEGFQILLYKSLRGFLLNYWVRGLVVVEEAM